MLPLGRYAALRSNDRDDAERSIRMRHPGMHGFVTRGAAKDWSISINAVDLGRGKISAVETGACSLSNVPDGVVRAFLPFSGGLEVTRRGAQRMLPVGRLTMGPLGEFACSYANDQRSLIVALPQKAIQDALNEFEWRGDLTQKLDDLFLGEAGGFEHAARHLLNLVRALEMAPEQGPAQKRFFAAYDELLILQIARVLAFDEERETRPVGSGAYLSRALDFMHAHLFDEIGPIAVARAAGCSLRNLQLLFQRDFGETITGRLRHLRLEAARDRLSSPQDQDTITSIAIDCGFSHLSDFARHYRTLFGELPSQTLNRSRATTIS